MTHSHDHDEAPDDEQVPRDEMPLTMLLRLARTAYGNAVGSELWDVGIEDMPRNGPLLLSGIADGRRPLDSIMKTLTVSRQAASQLIDTLVLRGYLVRGVDEEDRRRIRVELTARGELAAATTLAAVVEINERLKEEVGEEAFETTCRTLRTLVEQSRRHHSHNEE